MRGWKSTAQRPGAVLRAAAAVLAGGLVGCAFPPVDLPGLVWIGLVPLLWVVAGSESLRSAFACGFLAGLACFLIAAEPLTSADVWSGWAGVSSAELAEMQRCQGWFLRGLWLAIAAWIGLFWGAFAAGLHALGAHRRPWRRMIAAPCLWILLPEWLRAETTWGFQWGFLGNALADIGPLRQVTALGGIWLGSVLVVVVNAGLLAGLAGRGRRRAMGAPLAALLLLVGVGGAGALRLRRMPATEGPLLAAAVQVHRDTYTADDFLSYGLDREALAWIDRALDRPVDLVVLPESLARGAVSLDGTTTPAKPAELHSYLSDWNLALLPRLAGAGVLVIGLDTSERGRLHNSMVAWSPAGPAGWYHKRRLVPFAEYSPALWGERGIRGESRYEAGEGPQVIEAAELVLGAFICQEVLFPSVPREAVREGATLLVSGGNDGVFADRAVARVHADLARLRAVETGRYVVRAMKTGISAIIDPVGREVSRSSSDGPALLVGRVAPRTSRTPYVRFGDWPLSLAAAAVVALTLSALRRRR